MKHQADILKYSCEDVDKFVKETAQILKMVEHEVLDELEKTVPGIKMHVHKCTLKRNHPSRNLELLSGINDIAFFRDVMGKRILLLGESHDFEGICSNKQLKSTGSFSVEKWLYQLSQNSPECLDIFIEYPHKPLSSVKVTHDSPIARISNTFKECGYNKSCNIEQLRFHQVDIRRHDVIHSFGIHTVLDEDGDVKDENVKDQQKFLKHEKLYSQHKTTIINYALSLDKSVKSRNVYVKYFYGIMDIFFEIDDKTQDEILQTHLRFMKIIDKELIKLDKSKISRAKLLKSLRDVYTNMTNNNIYEILFMIPMDLYVLSRIFILFDKTKMNRSVSGCRDSKYSEIKNVIICSGGAHTDIYKDFMLNCFHQQPTFSDNKDDKCIMIKSIVGQPFDFYGS